LAFIIYLIIYWQPSISLHTPAITQLSISLPSTDKDHWLILSIREFTWATVASILATLPPIFPILSCLSCPLVYVLFFTLFLLLFNCNDSIDFSVFANGKRQNKIQYDLLIKIFMKKLPETFKRQQRILPRQKENNLRLQHPW
jgi:hypothetical protein